MQLSNIFTTATFVAAVSAVKVSFDRGYDDASRSLTTISCSDGSNGLITRFGWTTQGQIPRSPYIGGAAVVGGYNSASCGTCWKLEYNGKSINVLAIDHAGEGFNIAFHALDDLANGQAEHLGHVDATATSVPASQCGL